MSENVVCVFIDALRPDFIDKLRTPFLFKHANSSAHMEIETVLGYSDVIDATIFTGAYPNVHGYWMKYHYDPENSPFNSKVFLPLRIIDYIPSPFVRSGINYVLYNTFYKMLASKLGYYELASFNIPYYLLDNFNITMKKSMMDNNPFIIPTIFDILRSNNKKFYYSHGIKSDSFRKMASADLTIIYLSDIDFWAHLVGIDSPKLNKTLSKLDKMVESIFKSSMEINSNTTFIIFADHGMANVNEIIDFKKILNHKDYNKRFLAVLDGTMIRFWYFDDEIKSIIRSLFLKENNGHFLSEAEKNELKINFEHNKWGDDIYLLDQGYAIYPNFMSWAKPKAMHAYHPKYKEQRGSFILSGKKCKKLSSVRLIDIMPTILESLKLCIPDSVQGISVLMDNDNQ